MTLAITAAVITFVYTILLPYDFTQRFSIANWAYLTPLTVLWCLALGLGMAFVLTVQVHAMRRATPSGTGALGGVAFIASLLPSFLCCTPVIPTLLALGGLSAASLYVTTGALQHFFATEQTPFLAGSLALIALSAWWSLRKVARASCLAGDEVGPGCPTTDRQRCSDERTTQ